MGSNLSRVCLALIQRARFKESIYRNRREALTGQNGERFGKLACHAMGYGVESLKYIGLQDGYERYMARANSNVDCSVGGLDQSPNNEPTQCLPNYKIAGATCSNAELRSKEINKERGHSLVEYRLHRVT